ncbi:MAG TPA: DUF1127 domain-containing protein [Pseudomonas sp.]|nr:DUF1127 domain-containing protein [Pseudomonas sp.]
MDSTVDRTQTLEGIAAQAGRVRTWARRGLAILRRWQQYARTRRQLAQLDERQLADLGISPADRAGELDKPFWR